MMFTQMILLGSKRGLKNAALFLKGTKYDNAIKSLDLWTARNILGGLIGSNGAMINGLQEMRKTVNKKYVESRRIMNGGAIE